MKVTFTKHIFMICVALFGFQMVNAQTAFWEEDFSDGDLPAGWTTEDVSGGVGAWAWCGDPIDAFGCIPNWTAYSSFQTSFNATTATNGFLFVDSDALGTVVPAHIVEFTTTSIDCSNQPEVWLKLESVIGVFELDATENAIVRVSTNGMDWTDFNLFELTTADRWSNNPQYTFVDISSVAGNQSTVYLQFSWTGNYEYWWCLDDLAFYDSNPISLFIFPHDMQVNDNFFAIANNAMWPASQLESIHFLADIENVGYVDQSNVSLNLTIDNGSGPVYTEDYFYGNIAADSLAENQLFPGSFTPDPTPGTSYSGIYTITADSTDLNPDNNTQSFNFTISDTLFSKEMGATNGIFPADSNWEGVDEVHSWTMGNCYYVPEGDGYYARTIAFGLANAGDPGLPTRLISLILWEWDYDDNGDGDCDPEERVKVGQNFYEIQGTETLTDVITLPLLSPTSGMLEPIPLKDTTKYLAMIQYETNDQVNLYFAGSLDFNYGAQVFLGDSLATPILRQAEMISIDGDLESVAIENGAFASGIVPIARLSIGETPLEIVGTKDLLSDDNVMSISPNPASDNINLLLDLTEVHQQATVRIMDVSGKVVMQRKYEDVQQENFFYNISNFANGTYFVQFISDLGMKSERFIISK